jgi:hypothetical protein
MLMALVKSGVSKQLSRFSSVCKNPSDTRLSMAFWNFLLTCRSLTQVEIFDLPCSANNLCDLALAAPNLVRTIGFAIEPFALPRARLIIQRTENLGLLAYLILMKYPTKKLFRLYQT